ncbi:MAG: hypothetical protein AABW73_02100 [Nanoarchaeota archaeon]
MNKTLVLSIIILLLASASVSAISFSQSYNQDLVRVKEKWSYQEDTTGKLRGFNLIHTFSVPRERMEVTIKDNTNTQTTSFSSSGSGHISLGSFGNIQSSSQALSNGFSTGIVGSSNFGRVGGNFGSDDGLNQAFGTFRQNNRVAVTPRYSSGRFVIGYY